MAERILNDDYAGLRRFAGKVLLAVWHHGWIPVVGAALGANTPWADQQFDRIWRIDYGNGRRLTGRALLDYAG
ncbi:MAG TPA: hypothetical protein VK638_56875 [Edaphobacter sp.]|nr:hypothetical protein [Edaphobacter sp.]